MHKIMQLKEELIDELGEFAGKKKTTDDLLCIKYLASSVDHMCNIIESAEEEEYSNRMSRAGGRMSRRSYDDGMRSRSYDDGSYEGGSSYVQRDRMGRFSGDGYSRAEDMAVRIRDLMRDAPDDETRNSLHRLADRLTQR